MDKVEGNVTRRIMIRLMVSGIIFAMSLLLSAAAFYYYYVKAPIVPLVVGLMGWLPLAIMLMSLQDLRLLKVKKPQQAHYPPNRPQKQEDNRQRNQ